MTTDSKSDHDSCFHVFIYLNGSKHPCNFQRDGHDDYVRGFIKGTYFTEHPFVEAFTAPASDTLRALVAEVVEVSDGWGEASSSVVAAAMLGVHSVALELQALAAQPEQRCDEHDWHTGETGDPRVMNICTNTDICDAVCYCHWWDDEGEMAESNWVVEPDCPTHGKFPAGGQDA